MVDSGFIETSIFIGYCVTADQHHDNCRSYVEGDSRDPDAELVSTERVRNEYYRTKDAVVSRLTKQLQEHRQRVKQFLRSCDDPIGLPVLESLKTQTLDSGWDIQEFMVDFYEDYDYVYHENLNQDLRDLIRDIESLPRDRIDDLDERVTYYEPTDTYEEIDREIREDSLFDEMESEDRSICLEAHDLAYVEGDDVEFATANPQDFCYDGREEKLLELTELAQIRNLAN